MNGVEAGEDACAPRVWRRDKRRVLIYDVESMRILVVEDEQNVAAFIKQGLTEEGYVVDAVGDGELALSYAQTYDYDLILLDVLLPKMDGRQVALALRQRGIQRADRHADGPGRRRRPRGRA